MVRFYEEVLVGLDCTPQSPPDAMAFATPPIAFAVRAPLPGVQLNGGLLRLGVAFWLKTDDARALLDQLQRRGVPIVRPRGVGVVIGLWPSAVV